MHHRRFAKESYCSFSSWFISSYWLLISIKIFPSCQLALMKKDIFAVNPQKWVNTKTGANANNVLPILNHTFLGQRYFWLSFPRSLEKLLDACLQIVIIFPLYHQLERYQWHRVSAIFRTKPPEMPEIYSAWKKCVNWSDQNNWYFDVQASLYQFIKEIPAFVLQVFCAVQPGCQRKPGTQMCAPTVLPLFFFFSFFLSFLFIYFFDFPN